MRRLFFSLFYMLCSIVVLSAAEPVFSANIGYGFGWTQRNGSAFDTFLSDRGLGEIDPERLWHWDWNFDFSVDWFYFSIKNCHSSNFLFGAYGDPRRTELIWDEADLTLGADAELTDFWQLGTGLGVGLSSYRLITYPSADGSFDAVYGAGGLMQLEARWNWIPVAEAWTRFVFRKPEASSGTFLRLSAWGGLPLFDTVWKLFGDSGISDVPKPADWFIRYTISFGTIIG